MTTVGISLHGQGSSVCLVRDGVVAAVAREEWFSRLPGDTSIPLRALQSCLEQAGLEAQDVEMVACAIPNYAPSWRETLTGAGSVVSKLRVALRSALGLRCRFRGVPYHEALVATAGLTSPYENAVAFVATAQGGGPFSVTGHLRNSQLTLIDVDTTSWPVCALSSAFAAALGDTLVIEEERLGASAALGDSRYLDLVRRKFVDRSGPGTHRLKIAEAGADGVAHVQGHLKALLSRKSGEERRQHEHHLARAIQQAMEDALLTRADHLRDTTGANALVLGGDYAVNSLAVRRLVEEGPFDTVWIPPAPLDAAPGAALAPSGLAAGRARCLKSSMPFYAGPAYTRDAIRSYLDEERITYQDLSRASMLERLSQALAEGATVGWFQGAMACGPWGLGARAILADPRRSDVMGHLNEALGRGTRWRTFCAAVQADRFDDYFRGRYAPKCAAPVASLVRRSLAGTIRRSERKRQDVARLAASRSELPAITDVEGRARVLLVEAQRQALLYDLLDGFHRLTGCGVLLCGDFRREHEPTVTTPRDAYECFMAAGLHYLALGSCLLDRRDQPLWNG